MEAKLQLQHPTGKKAVRMDQVKYDVLKKVLLPYLQANGESSHADIFQAITEDFQKNRIAFAGSVEWHLEWVKLDLEARQEIERVAGKSPVKFRIVKSGT